MVELLEDWKLRSGYNIGASFGAMSGSKQQLDGIRYHRRFYKALEARYPTDEEAAREAGQWHLLVEPWFRRVGSSQGNEKMRQPDAVLVDYENKLGICIEAKLNWKSGRDAKLIDEYVPIVKRAFRLDVVWPLVVTGNVRGYNGKVLLGLDEIEACMEWRPCDPTPMLLFV